MLTDGLILRLIEEENNFIDQELSSLSWNELSIINTSKVSGLIFWKENFNKINQMLIDLSKKLNKNSTKNKLIELDFRYLLFISGELDNLNNLNNSTGSEEKKIIHILTRCTTRIIYILCYYSIVTNTIFELSKLRDSRNYFHSIVISNLNRIIFALQTSIPRLVLLFRRFAIKDYIETIKNCWKIRFDFRDISRSLYASSNLKKVFTLHKLQFIGLPSKLTNTANLIKLPFWSMEQSLKEKLTLSDLIIDNYSNELNNLIQNFNVDSKKNLSHFLNKIGTLPSNEIVGSTYQVVLGTNNFLQKKYIDKRSNIDNIHYIQKPHILIRIWPFCVLSLILGPKLIQKFWFNRFSIFGFCKENIWDFARGLIENWIWLPVKNIWSTVKHDDESEISVVSKGSLQSEKASLSRMIIQYMIDNKGSLRNAETNLNLDSLTKQIEHGQLDEFMSIYEKQLNSPLQSLITGKLIRSILIQIQKTKVDGSLALNGIDKMLKSQQLVFEMMALSPSLIIIFTIFTSLRRLIKLGNVFSNMPKTKRELNITMRNVERMINESFRGPMKRSTIPNGLIVIEISNMYMLGKLILPKWQLLPWYDDCLELLINDNKQDILNRIYHIYGKFL